MINIVESWSIWCSSSGSAGGVLSESKNINAIQFTSQIQKNISSFSQINDDIEGSQIMKTGKILLIKKAIG